MNVPCKDCKDRAIGCHSSCERYIAFDKERQKIRAEKMLRLMVTYDTPSKNARIRKQKNKGNERAEIIMGALNLNKVTLCGRLTADVELKATPSGRSVISFNIAVNRPRGKDNAEQKADFLNCVAWDKTAEFISKYFHKGESLYIEGALRTRNYKDKDGRTVYVTEVYISDVRFVDSKSTATMPEGAPHFEEFNDDNLPF